jgi:hypothetical protein
VVRGRSDATECVDGCTSVADSLAAEESGTNSVPDMLDMSGINLIRSIRFDHYSS